MAHVVPIAKLPFDYGIVPQNEATELIQLAVKIRSGGRVLTRIAIKIGEDLLIAKRYLNHGNFEDWCYSETGLKSRIAQSYMSLAKFADGDRNVVNGLTVTAACKLAAPSTPEQVITTVIGRLKQGEKVTLDEIVELIQVTKNKTISVHGEDTEVSKIRALVDDVRAALNPPVIEQLKQFFDSATPASVQIFKAELNKKVSG